MNGFDKFIVGVWLVFLLSLIPLAAISAKVTKRLTDECAAKGGVYDHTSNLCLRKDLVIE